MYQFQAKGILVFTFLFSLSFLTVRSDIKGSVSLDWLTFDKVVSKFDISLVKFDVQYPYGEKQDEFGNFAKELVNTPGLLIADVGVQDYGDNENKELSTKYGLEKDDFPAILLFSKGSKEPIRFPVKEDFKSDRIKAFLRQNSNVRIVLEKCLESFDVLAESFMKESNKEAREKIVDQAKESTTKLESEDWKKSADIYVKLMQKVLERGDKFVESENERVKNLLAGKVSKAKKAELQARANILQSFFKTKIGAKQEL